MAGAGGLGVGGLLAGLPAAGLSHFSSQTKLTEITPRHIASFVGWLCEQTKPAATKEDPDRRVPLSDKTVRNALGPLKACLATARREGLIRHKPATDVALPHRARVDDDDDRPQPFPRVEGDDGEPIETMELVVERIHESHRLMFALLAATGLRRSELLVLEGRHLALEGERPHVKVRQRVRRRRGEGLVIGPLKSRYSKRDVPIPPALADRLHALGTAPADFAFSTATGTVLDPDNLAMRVLAPACEAAGVEWAGFHTFRRLAPVCGGSQRRAGTAVARPSFGQLYARHLRPPARERSRRAAPSRRWVGGERHG